jgi:hypothetical protein
MSEMRRIELADDQTASELRRRHDLLPRTAENH